MDIEVKPLSKKDLHKAVHILSETFAEDKGIQVLFPDGDTAYQQKLRSWFSATLNIQLKSGQLLWGAYQKEDLKAVMVVNHSENKLSIPALLKWTLAVLISCGFTTVKRTLQHDQNRRNFLNQKPWLILEFVATEPENQGKGLAKKLFEKLQQHAQENKESIWLETTKPKNIQIFEKTGFGLSAEYRERGVTYFVMVRE